MDFFVMCIDKPGHRELRESTRGAHLSYLRENDSVVQGAGPILSEDRESVVGSLLLIRADDQTTATTFLEGDPYVKAGLFESTQMRPWKWLVKPAP